MPEEFIKGLTSEKLQGRTQIIQSQSQDDVMFYLDTPESMQVCADWFSIAVKQDNYRNRLEFIYYTFILLGNDNHMIFVFADIIVQLYVSDNNRETDPCTV